MRKRTRRQQDDDYETVHIDHPTILLNTTIPFYILYTPLRADGGRTRKKEKKRRIIEERRKKKEEEEKEEATQQYNNNNI